jgi:hypothetical protein
MSGLFCKDYFEARICCEFISSCCDLKQVRIPGVLSFDSHLSGVIL